MATKRLAFASILIGLFMALSLMPGLAFAAADGSNAQGEELQIQPQATNGATSQANQANGDEIAPTTEPKPSQAIQAAHMSVFTTDTGKNLNARVVEGNGGLSYAVKSGGDCVSVDSNGALMFRKAGTAIITVTAAETGTHAQTSVDVPIKIYDHFDYTFTVGNTIECVDYYGYYPINKVEIKLKNGNTVVGSATINSPKKARA